MTVRKLEHLAVIVRSAEERTEALCRYLLCEQVRSDHVVVIREKPFSAALKASYVVGLDLNLPWTLCCDADVLISSDSIQRCLKEIQRYDENCLGLNGVLHDKFYGRAKGRGLHLYRTKHLREALKIVDAGRGQIRPETKVKELMAEKGFYWIHCAQSLGLHDHYQYYRDIFRKMATRSQKSPKDVSQLLKLALSQSNSDTDFHIAALGLRYGSSLLPEDVQVHSDQWSDVTESLLRCNGIAEKEPLPVTAESIRSVEANMSLLTDSFLLRRRFSRRHIWTLPMSVCRRLSGLKLMGKKKRRRHQSPFAAE